MRELSAWAITRATEELKARGIFLWHHSGEYETSVCTQRGGANARAFFSTRHAHAQVWQ
jgi:hypothetical protein